MKKINTSYFAALTWADGTPFDFANWADGEPSDTDTCTEVIFISKDIKRQRKAHFIRS